MKDHPQNSRRDLETARLQWQDGEPVSTDFDDVYFSRANGLEESRHVFIAGNNLDARWRQLAPGSRFTLMETGFGTGLNFLCASQLWLATAPADAVLHYVSVEKFPLAVEDLARALQPWRALDNLSAQLIAAYPPPVAGFHRRWLFDDRVCLTLIFDDALTGLEALCASDRPGFDKLNPVADAWFLDGFAPGKNPDLWSSDLFVPISRLSRTGTTAGTFTVARVVRDGLQQAGFSISKKAGFGHKRDMLVATKTTTPAPPSPVRHSHAEPPWHLNTRASSLPRHAVVIGAGIAGCATAHALARRGWQVTLVDRHPQPGAEASGNPQGILYPKLSLEDLALSLYARTALCHARAWYCPIFAQGELGSSCGVLVLPENAKDRERMPLIAERYGNAPELVRLLTGKELAQTAGIPLAAEQGLLFPGLGWIRPAQVCQHLAAGIAYCRAEVQSLHFEQTPGQESGGHWLLQDKQGNTLIESPVVILAAGHSARQFSQTAHLLLRQIRGQITALPATDASANLKTVICGIGYLAPAADGMHTLGATYGVDDADTALRVSDHEENWHNLERTDGALPGLFPVPWDIDQLSGRAAVRCTTPDYLPLAGPAPRLENFVETYAPLRRNAKADIGDTGDYWPGLWLNCGHGSRGFTYAPLAAEIIASTLCGEPAPIPRELLKAVHPARFIVRDLKRNRR